jgi:intraflagellar transport protein 46
MSSFKLDTDSESEDDELAHHDRYDEAHALSDSSEMDESVDTNLSASIKFTMNSNGTRDAQSSPDSSRGDSPPRFGDESPPLGDLESSSEDFSLGEESNISPPLVLTSRPMTSRRAKPEPSGRLSEDETSSDEELGEPKQQEKVQQEEKMQFSSEEEDSDESEDEEDQEDQVGGQVQNTDISSAVVKDAGAGGYKASDYNYLADTTELRMLFEHITRYEPKDCEIDTRLLPFIPDYMPALGTSPDVFLKVPLPDGKDDPLGLQLLDEPSGTQTDSSLLEMQLRATSKQVGGASQVSATVRTMEGTQKQMETQIDSWVANVAKLHRMNPPADVQYSRDMPDIDSLMQVWPEAMEEALVGGALPGPEMTMELEYYAKLICGMLDIPVHPGKLTQSLHVLFTLYSEFQANQHFNKPQEWAEEEGADVEGADVCAFMTAASAQMTKDLSEGKGADADFDTTDRW